MEYTKLGRTGLDVSRICLGCMSYGGGNQGNHAWSLGEEESRPFIKRALEAGINFFDTANRYSLGSSEEILGRAIKDFARRDEVVIATKVYGRMRPGPNGGGLSRKALRRAGGEDAIMVDTTDDGIRESNKATPTARRRSEELALGSFDRLEL
jgi:aryl-alcohol dehydrogenase-like predicted oxidoreductase